MQEIWKQYHGYLVSNYGRVKNKHGRELSPITQKDKIRNYLYVTLHINKKRCKRTIAPLVAELFLIKNKNCGKKIRCTHIDGDYRNCRADNLKICDIQIFDREEWQIQMYNKNIVACCKHIFKKNGYFELEKIGFDVDNCLCECYLDIWIYLPKIKSKNGSYFYSFCEHQCRYVFCRLYKKYSEKLKREISYDLVKEKK